MNQEQIKAYYHRFCRWQQAVPHYVNRHEAEVQHCQNCGTEFADNFCPRCGQRAEVGRVGWKSIKESIALLWGMDSRSLGYTLFQLLTMVPFFMAALWFRERDTIMKAGPLLLAIIILLISVMLLVTYHISSKYKANEK